MGILVNDDAGSDNPLVDKASDVHNNYSKDKMISSSVAAIATLATGGAGLIVGVASGQFSNTEDFDGLNDGTIVDSIWQTAQQIEQGDWASAIAGGAGLVVDVVGAVTDPFSFIAGQLIGWMLEHVEPLRAALHQLTGNPDMVEGYAKTWDNIAGKMADQGTAYADSVKADTAGWSGAAADAYRKNAALTVRKYAGAAVGAKALAEAMRKMKDVVEAVRGGVRDILADLAGTLIVCAIKCASVVGAPDAVRSAIQAIIKDAIKISELLLKLTMVITKLAAVITDLVQLQQELNSIR